LDAEDELASKSDEECGAKVSAGTFVDVFAIEAMTDHFLPTIDSLEARLIRGVYTSCRALSIFTITRVYVLGAQKLSDEIRRMI
jgi:hypothetical protein